MLKAFDCVDHNELENSRDLPCVLRNLCVCQEATVRTGLGTIDWFQVRKEYIKAVYCHPAYLTYTQSTSYKMPGWMNYKPESRLLGEISTISDMEMILLKWRKVKRNLKSLLMRGKEEN